MNDAGLDMPVAGGIAIARRAGDESARLVAEGYVEGALAQGGRAAWATYRDDLSTAVPGLLGAGYKAATGQTLYDVLVELSADGPFISVSRDASGDLMVHLVTGRNSISATSTQPTFPQWGDPRFSFAFGLEMTYRIDLPPITSKLTATGFVDLHVTDPQFDSHNVPADVLMVANAIHTWISGTDLVTLFEERIAGLNLSALVNRPLAGVNRILESLAAQGYYYLEALLDRADGASQLNGLSFPGAPPGDHDLVLLASAPDMSGAIEGELRWPESAGGPVPAGMTRAVRVGALLGARQSTVDLMAGTNPAALEPSMTTVPGEVRNGVQTVTLTSGAATLDEAQTNTTVEAEALGALVRSSAALSGDERVSVAQSARTGDAAVFTRLIGGSELFMRVADVFRRGPKYLEISAQMTLPDGTVRDVGELAWQWSDDSDGLRRLRYRLEGVPTDTALQVRCELSDTFQWEPPGIVAIQADGWKGTVTCSPHLDLTQQLDDGALRVRVKNADGKSLTRSVGDLAERGIIIVGGRGNEGEERYGEVLRADKGSVSVWGPLPSQAGTQVSLNPQPIPPGHGGEFDAASSRVAQPAAAVATGTVDRFGSVVVEKSIHAGLLDDVETDPHGFGTVTGIDFTVNHGG